jgi:hypothetical protein
MNRNDFIRIIRDSGQIDRHMIGEVRELLDLFPFFQSAHLLLLKGLHNTGDVKFENQLKQSAIYVADREVLYYLLKKEPSLIPDKKEETIITAPIVNEATDNQQVVIESGKNSEDLISELEKSATVISSGELTTTSLQVQRGHSVVVSAESETDESASVVFLFDNGSEPVEETVTYMDPSFTLPDRSDLLELDEDEFNVTDSSAEIIIEEKHQPETQDLQKQTQADLIEKFIIANPRIEPVRVKSDHPVEDISKPFVEESGEFVTETLAKIYVTQGYYSKAIDIYEKLYLKYPEKSSYFATQIEKVKALIKQ